MNKSNEIKIKLANSGIDSSKMLLSVLSKEKGFKKFDFKCPNAEKLHERTLFVPLYDGLDKKDVEKIKTGKKSKLK